jgi:hypothetical protein
MGLIETLFAGKVMTMGPSRNDPSRRVGTFNQDYVSTLPAIRAAEMAAFTWLVGEWTYENQVPATSLSPAYTDVGTIAFALCENDTWICLVGRDGRQHRHITYDPFSRRWMYVLIEGSYGVLHSPGWMGKQIVFTGHMTMLGVECEWRMTWTRTGLDEFGFVNEEQRGDGTWAYIDEWRYRRATRPARSSMA